MKLPAAVGSAPGMHTPEAITIVTPLAYEAHCLHRHVESMGGTILTCGPGRMGVESRLDALAPAPGSPVILAGTAGGLSPTASTGSVLVARKIIDAATGQHWTPPLLLGEDDPRSGTICQAAELVTTTRAKEALHEQTGADGVDLESAAFAALADARGWTWGVIRGISDGPGATLPPEAARWIDSHGKTRLGALTASLLLKPRLAGSLGRLRRGSRQAMDSVRRTLPDLLQETNS